MDVISGLVIGGVLLCVLGAGLVLLPSKWVGGFARGREGVKCKKN